MERSPDQPGTRFRYGPTDLSRPSLQGTHAACKEYRQRFRERFGPGRRNHSKSLGGVETGNDGALYVLHNSTQTQNHWLTLELVGHRSNRDAIAAEVKLTTAKGSQMATVTTAGSYLSSSDKRVHFGLGRETVAGTIEIHWPSGIRQTIKNVSADQILQVDEPSAGPVGKGPSK